MAKLIAFYSRADENYFGGAMKYIEVAINGSSVDTAREKVQGWV